MKRPGLGLAGLALLGLLHTTHEARAFCGFYVSGADAKLYNNATQVVLMREGTRTVLSMANNYQGPPENFAMVVPVPVVLQKENVKTLPRELFDRVDKLGAPRLVEYWERDPCGQGEGIGLGSIGTLGRGAGTGSGTGFGRGGEVEILARFSVGEYDIVILGASDSMALDGWLKGNGYRIPAGAEPHLRPYVQAGSKFFVARVDASKVTFKDGQAQLSPLRFHYDSDTFSLPIRLGLINAGEAQDLIVNIIARNQRYEVANYPNVTIPTNLDVDAAAGAQFGSFYAALFDQTLEKHPGAVVTEYAWDSGSCDPCPEPALDGQELVTLGADTLPLPPIRASGPRTIPPQVRMGATKVKGPLPPEVIQRIVRQSFGRFRMCYENGLRNNPTLEGRVSVAFTIDRTGAVSKPSSAGTDIQDEKVIDCVVRSFNNLSFPEPQGAPVSVIYPIYFSNGAGAASASSAAPPPPPPVLAPNPGGFVLTRLHARYRKDGLADDLVFRPAPAIAGGRETRGADQQLEQGASVASQNTFQGRYAIRHPWEGKITCDQPRRGIWGAPPTGTIAPTRAATGLAFAPRNVPLSRFLPAGIPSGASSVAPPSLSNHPTPAAASSSSSGSASSAPAAGRCGCHTPGGDRSPGGWLALLGLAAIRGRRRPHDPAGRGRALT